jgi:hypothetical protein
VMKSGTKASGAGGLFRFSLCFKMKNMFFTFLASGRQNKRKHLVISSWRLGYKIYEFGVHTEQPIDHTL